MNTDSKTLTKKQRSFVEHFYRTRKGSLSARLAGYSTKTSDQIACNLLHQPRIRSLLKTMLAEVGQEL